MNTYVVEREVEDRFGLYERHELFAYELSDAEILALPPDEQATVLEELGAVIEDGEVVAAPAAEIHDAPRPAQTQMAGHGRRAA